MLYTNPRPSSALKVALNNNNNYYYYYFVVVRTEQKCYLNWIKNHSVLKCTRQTIRLVIPHNNYTIPLSVSPPPPLHPTHTFKIQRLRLSLCFRLKSYAFSLAKQIWCQNPCNDLCTAFTDARARPTPRSLPPCTVRASVAREALMPLTTTAWRQHGTNSRRIIRERSCFDFVKLYWYCTEAGTRVRVCVRVRVRVCVCVCVGGGGGVFRCKV